jgi:hypothetical protein
MQGKVLIGLSSSSGRMNGAIQSTHFSMSLGKASSMSKNMKIKGIYNNFNKKCIYI